MSDNTSFVKTPPMGWNSWDCYGTAVNEETVRANAKFMAENLKQFGWQYIVVDIQWLCSRFYQTMAANTVRQINTSWNTIYLMPFICGKFSRYHSTALFSRLNYQYTFRHSVDDSVARREVSSKRFCSRCKFCYQRPI